MKKKLIINLVSAAFLILSGTITLLLPVLKIVDIKGNLVIVFGLMALINLLSFLISPKDKDYETLSTFIFCLLITTLFFFLKLTPLNLAIILIISVALISLVRLKKADFYNDRKNKAWIIQIITLFIFILTGLVTSINLYYTNEVQILMFGYFFFINGILELIDPLMLLLVDLK